MSTAEERSDRVLANGARLYNDHGHPEYSTPECSNLRDLVAHDRAGIPVQARAGEGALGRPDRPRDPRPGASHDAGWAMNGGSVKARGGGDKRPAWLAPAISSVLWNAAVLCAALLAWQLLTLGVNSRFCPAL